MQQVNPGIAKGYALDFAAPLRFVAEQLSAGPRTLDELWRAYEHDSGDLSRVWDHELRERGQRRSARPEIQAQREADAKRWLLEAAIAALGAQVREDGERLALAVPLEDVRVRGLPVALPTNTPAEQVPSRSRAERAPASGRRAGGRRAASRAGTSDAPPAPAEPPAPEPESPSPLREWLARNGYSEQRLARALDLPPHDIAPYLEARSLPRVVRLALWALERGAEDP